MDPMALQSPYKIHFSRHRIFIFKLIKTYFNCDSSFDQPQIKQNTKKKLNNKCE